MQGEEVDQTQLYGEYFALVKLFHSSNDEYLNKINELTKSRQLAIGKAEDPHIKPLLAKLRSLQATSAIIGILSFLFFCGSLNLLSKGSTSSSSGIVTGGFGWILTLISIGAGILMAIVFLWISTKISDLNSEVRYHKQTPPDISKI